MAFVFLIDPSIALGTSASLQAAFLIENLTWIVGFLDAAFEVCGLCRGGDRKYISICVYTNILL
jgi:hypothetical protein